MPKLDLIARPDDFTRSIHLTRFEYDEQTVFDTYQRLTWIRTGNYFGQRVLYNSAVRLLHTLNRTGYAGYHDWRLPTIDELTVMAAYGVLSGWGGSNGQRVSDFLNRRVFRDVEPDLYWSCTMDTWIYGISMSIGKECYVHNRHDGFAWPVRGGRVGKIHLMEVEKC